MQQRFPVVIRPASSNFLLYNSDKVWLRSELCLGCNRLLAVHYWDKPKLTRRRQPRCQPTRPQNGLLDLTPRYQRLRAMASWMIPRVNTPVVSPKFPNFLAMYGQSPKSPLFLLFGYSTQCNLLSYIIPCFIAIEAYCRSHELPLMDL